MHTQVPTGKQTSQPTPSALRLTIDLQTAQSSHHHATSLQNGVPPGSIRYR